MYSSFTYFKVAQTGLEPARAFLPKGFSGVLLTQTMSSPCIKMFRRWVYSRYAFTIVLLLTQFGVLYNLKVYTIRRVSPHSHQLFPPECSYLYFYLYNYQSGHDSLDIKFVNFLSYYHDDPHLCGVILSEQDYYSKQFYYNIHIFSL